MNELLAPAGTKQAFHAAIANGANAIYLGLDRFSARAYADNFTLESLKDLLDFAHLRNVKIYVTINTIIYDDELDDAFETLDQLAKMGVDGIIVQDLAIANYITNHYASLSAHASTQMGIDDLDAAQLVKELGFSRIVFARETSIKTMKNIKQQVGLEVEAFIHGALCVSYSGNCYMSSAIGERSGNRGRCAGCCRKFYTLVNTDDNHKVESGYLLSMKDLNTAQLLTDLDFVDSLKIEGRMKEPNYVASVTNTYRHLLDHEPVDLSNLDKVFNRTYTKGFMNGETSATITNIEKPNNYGYPIGTVIKQNKQTIWIRLNKPLSKGDQIRIETKEKQTEISVPVLKLFDNNLHEIQEAHKIAVLSCKPTVEIGAAVYKTKDDKFVEEANRSLLNNEYQKLPIQMEVNAQLNKPFVLKVFYQKYKVFMKSEINIEGAITTATTKENIIQQLSKLNDTPYFAKNITIEMNENLFIPLKLINEMRRKAIEQLNELRIARQYLNKKPKEIAPQKYQLHDPIITVQVSNEEQYQVAKELGIKHIYYKNALRRNNVNYPEFDGEVLVAGLGGIHHYLKSNPVVSDTSLNVVNHRAVAILSELGVERITLSEEISKPKINYLIMNYFNEYNTYPNLELVVYGRSKIMHSRYCPLKRLGLCGQCKEHHFALQDEYAQFPIIFNDDCTITLLNSKPLNIMDDVVDIKGINYFRLSFTDETNEETKAIIESFQKKLSGKSNKPLFNHAKYTRGHFNSNPL